MAERNGGRWYHHQVSKDELKVFVDESLVGKGNKKAFIGNLLQTKKVEAGRRFDAAFRRPQLTATRFRPLSSPKSASLGIYNIDQVSFPVKAPPLSFLR
jgi:hypothetical protein